ncbi:hypothetical protein KY284_012905 [Solanum tuberosum]|nr:hypothetical protein KY284_012905 [Solanum tuberosum]
MNLTRSYDMFNFEFGLSTLRDKVRAIVGMETPPYPIAGKSEQESHDLHLAWCDETVQFKFEIEMLKANMKTQEGIKVDIEDILSLCNQLKPITI